MTRVSPEGPRTPPSVTGPIRAGDIGFARTKGLLGRLIRLGEHLRFHRGSQFNHMFVVDRQEDGVWYIIQATLRGVTDSARLVDVAPGGTFLTMGPPYGADRDRLLAWCRRRVGQHYGYLTIAAIALDVVTWDWVPSLRGARKDSWICSALACEGLRFAGWDHDWPDIYSVTPADAYQAIVP